jgi:hypothetical protein
VFVLTRRVCISAEVQTVAASIIYFHPAPPQQLVSSDTIVNDYPFQTYTTENQQMLTLDVHCMCLVHVICIAAGLLLFFFFLVS